MSLLPNDIRCGLRSLRQSPVLTCIAVVILGLGIGATTAVFSVMDALFLRLLPFPEPEQLVSIAAKNSTGSSGVGPEDFNDWRSQSTAFQYMAYTFFTQANLTQPSTSAGTTDERLTGSEVSADFFSLLGVHPLLGRWFWPEEQSPARNSVIILSHSTWVSRFGANKNIVGESLALSGQSYTVVGVMPPGFRFNEGTLCEYWVPLQHSARGRNIHQYTAYGRLKRGVSVANAQVQLSAIAKRLELAFPASNTGWGVRVTPLQRQLRNEFGPTLTIAFIAAGLVLLIACANVASLLLARTTTRQAEIAIRRALGAGPLSIVRLLLAESLLLSAGATAFALLISGWMSHAAAALAPSWLQLNSILEIDGRVMAFTLLLTFVTAAATGLVPALQVYRTDVNSSLRPSGHRTGENTSRVRALNVIVIGEIAMAALLLASAGLLVRSFQRLLQVDLGFSSEKILTARIALRFSRYPQPEQRLQFYAALIERVRALPSVTSVGAVDAIPLGGAYSGGPFDIEGRPSPANWTEQESADRSVTPDYFRTLNIPLVRGRYFDNADREGSLPVAIINEQLQHSFFRNEDPLGKRIRSTYTDRWLTIVGVVGNVRHATPERTEGAAIYRPHAQEPDGHMFIAIRSDAPASLLAQSVRGEIRALDRELVPLQVRTMSQALSESRSGRREVAVLTAVCAAVALILAVLGVCGVLWYAVSRRTHEIGVRMALGAPQQSIVRLVLRHSLALTLLGLVLGLGAASLLSKVIAAQLYGTNSRDPVVFGLVAVLLVGAAVGTSLVPARRAATVDPMVALRYE